MQEMGNTVVYYLCKGQLSCILPLVICEPTSGIFFLSGEKGLKN